MSFTKIVEGDLTNKGVRGLPDTPNLGTTDMQNKFEELSTDVIIPKHNGLIDELENTSAAASIGALDANGDPSTVQAELVSIKSDAYTKAQADALFLTQADAVNTYLTQTDADNDYLKKNDAANTYLAQTDAANTYLSQSDANNDYLKKTDAANTYLSQANASTTYLSKADAASTYVAQEVGKGLSTNDYDNNEKNKLAGIEAGANNYVLPAGTQSTLGGVMGDGTTFTIDANGVGHAIGGGGGTSDYDALINHPKINNIELIGNKSASSFGFTGSDIGFSNTTSGLSATTVQDAIDEVEGRTDTAESDITSLSGRMTTAEGNITNLSSSKEAVHTVLKSTLAVGATTLSFTDSAIGNNSLIRIYTNVDGVNPLTKTQSGTTVTLTFDAQSVAVGVAIEIRN